MIHFIFYTEVQLYSTMCSENASLLVAKERLTATETAK